MCNSFFKEVQNIKTSTGTPLFDALAERAQNELDLKSMTHQVQERIFRVANDALRVLRHDNPDVVIDIILLFGPRLGEPWAKCSLLPKGLPLLQKYTVNALHGFKTPMGENAAVITQAAREKEKARSV